MLRIVACLAVVVACGRWFEFLDDRRATTMTTTMKKAHTHARITTNHFDLTNSSNHAKTKQMEQVDVQTNPPNGEGIDRSIEARQVSVVDRTTERRLVAREGQRPPGRARRGLSSLGPSPPAGGFRAPFRRVPWFSSCDLAVVPPCFSFLWGCLME